VPAAKNSCHAAPIDQNWQKIKKKVLGCGEKFQKQCTCVAWVYIVRITNSERASFNLEIDLRTHQGENLLMFNF
jgi:hypothetical protein